MTSHRLVVVAALAASSLFGQHVITAKPGLVHYVEGEVTLAGKAVDPKPGEFPDIKKGDELRTAHGRAEVLLSPGVFLRVAEDSAFRMLANSLQDMKIELLAGHALLEVGEFDAKSQGLIVLVGDAVVEVSKRGLYRIDREPALLKVYEGSATVVADGQPVTIKQGRQTALSLAAGPESFDRSRGDSFHRWAARRSGYVSMANIAAARRVQQSNVNWQVANWLYCPYFGAFTYIPAAGMYRSPFGWAFYSPRAVERVYYRPPAPVYRDNSAWAGGGGGGLGGYRSYGDYSGRGSMGTYSAGGAAASAPATAAPAPSGGARSGEGGGGRGSAGGR